MFRLIARRPLDSLALRIGVLLCSVGLAVTATVVLPPPALSDMGTTQVAKLVGQKPVTGRYTASYTNYGEIVYWCPECTEHWFRVARGKLRTQLNTYKIKDGLRKYDFYVLDVDTNITDRSGTAKLGQAKIRVATTTPAIVVDSVDSRSISASKASCTSVDIGIGQGFGPVSASMDLGSVTFCDDDASFKVAHPGKDAVYTADRLPTIRHLTTKRVVKVKAGKRPRFKVTVTVPRDDCTASTDGLCTDFTNDTASYTYAVGTSG